MCPMPRRRCTPPSRASASKSANSKTSLGCGSSSARGNGSRRPPPAAGGAGAPRARRARRAFVTRYPKVKLGLQQGNPTQVAEHTARGDADVGIATEALATYTDLVTLPCYQWNRCVFVPRGHPLSKVQPLTLAALVRYPIVTYDQSFTGRSQINAAFDAAGRVPNVVLSALDSDVIKTYVEMGLGVGIIARMAWDPARDAGAFEQLHPGHLFAASAPDLPP